MFIFMAHAFDQVLKTHTREVLYEKFRTEKLLARRATRKIGEEQTKKLLEGVFPRNLPITCSALTPHSDLGL
jgi:septin family protein